MNCTITAIITRNTLPCATSNRQTTHCNHIFCCWYNCHIQIKSVTRFPAIWLWVKWCSAYAYILNHIAQEVDLRYPKVCDYDNIVHHQGILDWLTRLTSYWTLHCWPRKSYTGQFENLGEFWPYIPLSNMHILDEAQAHHGNHQTVPCEHQQHQANIHCRCLPDLGVYFRKPQKTFVTYNNMLS